AGEFAFSSYLNYGFPYVVTENETTPNQNCGFSFQRIIMPDRNALGALITVVRTNGSSGKALVDFATLPPGRGFATPFSDYSPTNGTLEFDDFQTSASFVVQVASFGLLDGDKYVRLVLSNPRLAPEEKMARPALHDPKLGHGSESLLIILEINDGYLTPAGIMPWFNFERANYRTDEYSVPGPNGGVRAFNLEVTLFPGGPGNVTLNVVPLPFFYYTDPASTLQRDPDPRYKLVINAGSEHAEAFENPNSTPFVGGEIWPNPPFTDPTLSPIINFSDYWPTQANLTFGLGECRKSVTLYVTNDNAVEF